MWVASGDWTRSRVSRAAGARRGGLVVMAALALGWPAARAAAPRRAPAAAPPKDHLLILNAPRGHYLENLVLHLRGTGQTDPIVLLHEDTKGPGMARLRALGVHVLGGNPEDPARLR